MRKVNEVEFSFTHLMKRVMKEAKMHTGNEIIYPHHLFAAVCQPGHGVGNELYLYLHQNLGKDFLTRVLSIAKDTSECDYLIIQDQKISSTTSHILKEAKKEMTKYNQSLLSIGHVVKAIIDNDHDLERLLGEGIKTGLKEIACSPRDLIVNLGCIEADRIERKSFELISRVKLNDYKELEEFIRAEFGNRWMTYIDKAFAVNSTPLIYIAKDNGKIVGFACFDIVRNKKGLFGPMGTSKDNRIKGIGKTLLYVCLSKMKSMNYEFAIIGEAGPIEFYERTCGARIIPK